MVLSLSPIPSGEKIFYRDYAAHTIGVIRSDGTGKQEIITSRRVIRNFSVSPDGQVIALSISDPSGDYTVGDTSTHNIHSHTWLYAGGEAKKVTGLKVQNIDDRSYAWVPDGSKLYISRFSNIRVENETLDYDLERIWVVDRNGENEYQIPSPIPKSVAEIVTSVSPDGQKLAYTWYDLAHPSLIPNLGFMGLAGEERQSAPLEGVKSKCIWSTDGDKLACLDGFYFGNLILVDPNGRKIKTLIDNGLVYSEPSWSQDGQQIAYVQFAKTPSDLFSEDIYILDLNTGQSRRVTESSGGYVPIIWVGQ